jgi:hypothetical protein
VFIGSKGSMPLQSEFLMGNFFNPNIGRVLVCSYLNILLEFKSERKESATMD